MKCLALYLAHNKCLKIVSCHYCTGMDMKGLFSWYSTYTPVQGWPHHRVNPVTLPASTRCDIGQDALP